MKYKMVTVIILTVLLLGGAIYETVYIEKTFSTFIEKLDEIAQRPEYELSEIEEAEQWWDKKSVCLSITITNTQINEINFTLGELKGAVHAQDFESAEALLMRIREYSDSLSKTYKFSIRNII